MPFRPDRFKEAREKKGLTQYELGTLSGMVASQISKYEHGKIEPSLKYLEAMAMHLDVSTDFLLGLTDDPHKRYGDTPIADEERIILETFRRQGWPGLIRLGGDRLLG